MRFSLKEFLVVVGAACLGMAALVYPSGIIVGILLLGLVVLAVAMLVHVFFVSGESRAFAIGFVCAGGCYAVLLAAAGSYAFEPWNAKIVTATAMRPVYVWIGGNRNYFVDDDGNRYSTVPPGAVDASHGLGGGGFGGGGFGGGRGGFAGGASPGQLTVTYVNSLPQEEFMQVAQCLWALLFGYLGGKYAVWVHTRQTE